MQMRNDESAFNGTHKTVLSDFYTKKAEQVNIPLEKRFNESMVWLKLPAEWVRQVGYSKQEGRYSVLKSGFPAKLQ